MLFDTTKVFERILDAHASAKRRQENVIFFVVAHSLYNFFH